jgi:uncharacterized protein YbjQ (UPF0145 family)
VYTKKNIIIVTTNNIENYEIEKVIGPVYGTSVRSRNIFGNFLGIFGTLFGGSQQGYIEMISATRDDALNELRNHASTLGANAVLAMRFDSGEFGNGMMMNEVTAYGTAVKLMLPDISSN